MFNQRLLPAILEQSALSVKRKLEQLAALSDSVQLDFMDGTLTDSKTLDLDELLRLATNFKIEVHLMVAKPSQYFLTLATGKVKACVIHQESYDDQSDLIKDCQALKALGISPSISCWPDAEPETVAEAKSYQIMGVVPGQVGQTIIGNTRTRALNLKQRVRRGVMISLDGGVTSAVVSDLADVVDRFIVNSWLYLKEPEIQWRLLEQALK
ncbi:MAG: hypothetical protein Q7S64_00650 [bacterium]|nr:hypothetical protein [bacterium]